MPGEAEEPAAEETTQTPQEGAGEEEQSEEDSETWEDVEVNEIKSHLISSVAKTFSRQMRIFNSLMSCIAM